MKRSALQRNPAAIRAWLQRTRTPLERTTELTQRAPVKRKATIPQAVRAAVVDRSGGWCVRCLWRYDVAPADVRQARGRVGRIAHLHHLLEERNFPAWAQEVRNLIGLCAACHDEHERAHRRVPWDALPLTCRVWLLHVASTDGAAYRAVRTNYPGAAGDHDQEDR